MKQRTFLRSTVGLTLASPLLAAMNENELDSAANVLSKGTTTGLIEAATLYVRQGNEIIARSFGAARSENPIFLLASISKPISIAAVMSLYDQGHFQLDDPAAKYIPEFTGDGRDAITICHLMTHVCGLPDQLPENAKLRSSHADLSEFVDRAIRTPLLFKPGSKYSYSSMGILLATEIAQRITGKPIATLVDEMVFQPLQMRHSALGVGQLEMGSLMRCQVEHAARESGAGDPSTKDWDWNSPYWRQFGSPWGGVLGSASDVAKFLDAFLHPEGKLLKPETARLMIANHNPDGLRPRGLGFQLGSSLQGPDRDDVFGHGGSTGTLCWADSETDTVFVVLTTLPMDSVDPHPRAVTSRLVAEATK